MFPLGRCANPSPSFSSSPPPPSMPRRTQSNDNMSCSYDAPGLSPRRTVCSVCALNPPQSPVDYRVRLTLMWMSHPTHRMPTPNSVHRRVCGSSANVRRDAPQTVVPLCMSSIDAYGEQCPYNSPDICLGAHDAFDSMHQTPVDLTCASCTHIDPPPRRLHCMALCAVPRRRIAENKDP